MPISIQILKNKKLQIRNSKRFLKIQILTAFFRKLSTFVNFRDFRGKKLEINKKNFVNLQHLKNLIDYENEKY